MRGHIFGFTLGAILTVGSALAQNAALEAPLVGTWRLQSWEQAQKDGARIRTFGESPKGIHVFDQSGRFVFMVARPDLPKNKSTNRLASTDEENKAIVQGTLAYFGTYRFERETGTLALDTEASTFPNQVGQGSRKISRLTADELEYANDSPGGLNVFKFRRAN